MIDATVLGGRNSAVRQYAVDGERIAAGKLQGMSEGSIVALVGDATADADKALARAQLEDVGATSAYLRPVSKTCRAGPPCEISDTLPATARFARPVEIANEIKVGLSLQGSNGAQFRDALQAALDRRITNDVMLADDGAIEARAHKGRLWFGRRALLDDVPVGTSWSPNEGEAALDALLARIVHAEKLAVTLDGLSGDDPFQFDDPVEITTRYQPAQLGQYRKGVDAVRECGRVNQRRAFSTPRDLPDAVRVNQCDLLRVTAQGNFEGMHDINRIHIDATFCVHVAHERVSGSRRPTPVGQRIQFCADCPSGPSAGDERLYIITTQAQPNAEPVNLKSTLENCALTPGGATRGGTAARLSQLLDDLRETNINSPTRGGLGGGGLGSDVWVKRLEWTVLPRVLSKPYSRNGN